MNTYTIRLQVIDDATGQEIMTAEFPNAPKHEVFPDGAATPAIQPIADYISCL